LRASVSSTDASNACGLAFADRENLAAMMAIGDCNHGMTGVTALKKIAFREIAKFLERPIGAFLANFVDRRCVGILNVYRAGAPGGQVLSKWAPLQWDFIFTGRVNSREFGALTAPR
jgi:hypothetical protein